MAGLLYFLPGVRLDQLVQDARLSDSLLKRYGLDSVLADVTVPDLSKQDTTGSGPGDKSGVMFCTNTGGQPPHRFGYHKEFQRWQKVRNQPELWIGIDKEHPSGPTDLARKQLLDGHLVKLADGNKYQVPYVRSPAGRTALPEDMYQDAEGQFVTELDSSYRETWEATAPVWDVCYPEDEKAGSMPYEDILTHCLRFLGLNYRYGHGEQAVLRLVNKRNYTWERIFQAVVDVPFLLEQEEAAKKNESP